MMNPDGFDLLARSVSAERSRRAIVSAIAGAGLGLVAGGFRRVDSRAAEPAPPLPPPSFDPWPVCSEQRTHYCVSTLIVDGVDQLASANPEYYPLVMGTGSSPSAAVATRLEWSVWSEGPHDPLSILDVEQEVLLRVRTGRLYPLVTFAQASRLRTAIAGDATSGWEFEARGRPGLLAYRDHPDEEDAAWEQTRFSGTGFDAVGGETQLWDGFEGYIVTTATEFAPPRWVGDGWNIFLGAPHLRPDASVNVGSYGAWMTAGSLQRLNLTTQQAVTGGLGITRIDGSVESAVDASISELDGGVLIEIPSLTFSSPTIAIRKRGGRGCPMRCRKGRVCKKGRCVKKKSKKR